MKINKYSLSRYIDRHSNEIDDAGKSLLFRNSFLYLCRSLGAMEYQKFLKTYDLSVSASQFRLGLTANSYYFNELRYFGLWFLTNKRSGGIVQELVDRFGIYTKDFRALTSLRRNTKVIGRCKRVLKRDHDGRVPNPEFLKSSCEELIEQVMPYIKRLVRRKLRFVSIFEGSTQQDLVNEVRARLVQQFYWAYRVRDTTWDIRSLKVVAVNAVNNMASWYSTTKRGQATKMDRNGISHKLILNESELRSAWDDDVVTLEDIHKEEPDSRSTETETIRHQEFQHMIKVCGVNRVKRRLLLVLSGNENMEFNAWLKQRRLIKGDETHVELQERVDRKMFLKLASNWLNLTQTSTVRFMNKVRNYLSENGYGPTTRKGTKHAA